MKLAALTVPASTDHVRTARLVAVAIATQVGCTLDTVDDVRLAVGEACVLGLRQPPAAADPAAQLEVEFQLDAEGTLCIRVRPCALDEGLATQVLTAVTPRITTGSDEITLCWPVASGPTDSQS